MECTPGNTVEAWKEAPDRLIGVRSEMPIGYNPNNNRYSTDRLLWRVGWAAAQLLFRQVRCANLGAELNCWKEWQRRSTLPQETFVPTLQSLLKTPLEHVFKAVAQHQC